MSILRPELVGPYANPLLLLFSYYCIIVFQFIYHFAILLKKITDPYVWCLTEMRVVMRIRHFENYHV